MHYIIGLISAVAGLFWALNRLQESGFHLSSVNPFLWMRRRQWRRQFGTKPIHQLEKPIEAAALLIVAMAQLEGVITREQKAEITQLFVEEFGINEHYAAELFASSSHMLVDVMDISAEVATILAPTISQFESRHTASLIKMLNKVSISESAISEKQLNYISTVEHVFSKHKSEQSKSWQ